MASRCVGVDEWRRIVVRLAEGVRPRVVAPRFGRSVRTVERAAAQAVGGQPLHDDTDWYCQNVRTRLLNGKAVMRGEPVVQRPQVQFSGPAWRIWSHRAAQSAQRAGHLHRRGARVTASDIAETYQLPFALTVRAHDALEIAAV
jgi:hypothetical protein